MSFLQPEVTNANPAADGACPLLQFLTECGQCGLCCLSCASCVSALPCPENSHFDECTSSCPLTCTNLDDPGEACPQPCQEGCQCEHGFVLHHHLCVARSDCGCVHHGRRLATNQTFWTDWECQERCYCNGSDNRVSCQHAPCGLEEYCHQSQGLFLCLPHTEAVCVAAGYGHFLPFGGVPFELQSSCALQMVTSHCAREGRDTPVAGALPPFTLTARNEERDTSQAIWVRGFVLEVDQFHIQVSRSYRDTVMVRESVRPSVCESVCLSIHQ